VGTSPFPENSRILTCIFFQHAPPVPLVPWSAAEFLIHRPGQFNTVDALGRHLDINLGHGQIKGRIQQGLRIHPVRLERLSDRPAVDIEPAGHIMNIGRTVAFLLGDPQMIGAEEFKWIDMTDRPGGGRA
jgi:hypothetical protein